jgi:hypothetical protein
VPSKPAKILLADLIAWRATGKRTAKAEPMQLRKRASFHLAGWGKESSNKGRPLWFNKPDKKKPRTFRLKRTAKASPLSRIAKQLPAKLPKLTTFSHPLRSRP